MANGDESEKRRPLTRSEKVRNYLIGMGAASALILGLVAQFKGEPVADKVWAKLHRRMNKISANNHKLHLRMVHLQGVGEGFHAGKLSEKLDQLQKKYDALKAGTPLAAVKPVVKPTKVGAASKPVKCRAGHIEVGGRCTRVRRAVAAKVKADAKAAAKTKRQLAQELKRRMALERKKAAMARKMAAQKIQVQAIKKLVPLPAKLDDAK